MGDVLKLVVDSDACMPGTGSKHLADSLRAMADKLEAGEYGAAQLIGLVIVDGDDLVSSTTYVTRHYTEMEYIGVLEVAKHLSVRTFFN